MNENLMSAIRMRCQPLAPRSTDAEPNLKTLPEIRAVLFDIYGTLMISASGDIGSDAGDHREQALADVATSFGFELALDASSGMEAFESLIRKEHALSREREIRYPEVDIVEIWRQFLHEHSNWRPTDDQLRSVALEFELRVNPTWPMPHCEVMLEQLSAAGRVLGIVSNAQFFTPLLFTSLIGKSLDQLGFRSNLSYFSFEHGRAKPGEWLYAQASRKLAEEGIAAAETLFVGNDMLNDITAARAVGFRTALFAGDDRSLRWRTDDERVHGVEADIVITDLLQLTDCLNIIA